MSATRLYLSDVLALVGRLADQPGADTARERFRRFLGSWRGSIEDVGLLIDDAQRTADDQSQRALMDLVVSLGRHLGFDVTYGAYERRSGAVRFDGAWRSAGIVRLVLEVRTDRTRPFSPDDLARTIAALPDVHPTVEGEQTIGLCVVVPVHGTRRGTDAPRETATHQSIRVVPLQTIVALVEHVRAHEVTHEQVAELLLSGKETPLATAPVESAPVQVAEPTPPPASRLSLVPKEEPPDYWIATILSDEGTTPEQFVHAVINGRQLLGVSAIGIFPANARAGDWVCFYLSSTGVVGHAQLAGQADGSAAPLRGAERFAAVFTLTRVELYDVPRPLDPSSPAQRLANRIPFEAPGPFLSPISQRDFERLTVRPAAHSAEGHPALG